MENNFNNKNLELKVLNIIRESGPITKQKIAGELGVNITTITNLVNKLFKKDKLLVESGEDTSSGGRRPKLYQINKKIGYVIGVDIGGRYTRVIITDVLGKIISSSKEKTNSEENGEEIVNKVLTMINKLIAESKISKEKILGTGMSIAGCIDLRSECILFCPSINGLRSFPIKKAMEEKTKKPIFFDDSSRCMAIAEKKYGFAKDYNNFIFVALGVDVGAGIYIDGRIYRGSTGFAGELGHTTVSENGPICKCGNRGCLEAIASGPGIIRRAREGIEKGIFTSLSSSINNNLNNLTVELISKAAMDGDKFAYYIINRTGEYIGIAISTALNLFGSDLVVLGGGISECGDILLNAIKRTIKVRAMDVISKRIKIIKSRLGDNTAALGAAADFIDMLFTDYR